MALLELKGLNKHFGGLHVTNAVDLALEEGEIHCLIGPERRRQRARCSG